MLKMSAALNGVKAEPFGKESYGLLMLPFNRESD